MPAEAAAVDTSHPTRVIGTGTPASCTSAAVVNAVAQGGIITFNCGPDPITITMAATAKIVNDTGPDIVIDGGNKVTLSGGDQRRILYMNTCDQAQVWTTSHCQNQDTPRLTVQNLTFEHGNSTGQTVDGGGGGAIFVRGGRFKIVNSRFFNNTCESTGPDIGGAAVRVLSQYQGLPVYVVHSTFGGAAGLGNTLLERRRDQQHRRVVGGAQQRHELQHRDRQRRQPAAHRHARWRQRRRHLHGRQRDEPAGRGHRSSRTTTPTRAAARIFFVSNNRTGTMRLESSTLQRNPNDGFQTAGFPGIFFLGSGAAGSGELHGPVTGHGMLDGWTSSRS